MMNGMVWRVACVGIVAGLALSVGCSGSQSDRPATQPVTGTVTLNGKPVDGAIITFTPKGSGRASVGTSTADGTYSMSTFAAGDGSVVGEYDVKIVQYQVSESTATISDESEEGAMITLDPNDTGAQKNLLPAKYAAPATSGLTATVGEEPNTIDFPLEK